jgi:hypothetical protein
VSDNFKHYMEEGKRYLVSVVHFPNGMYAVFDLNTGKQIPELQGGPEAKEKILKAVQDDRISVLEWKG